MTDFNPESYAPALAALLAGDRNRQLGPGRPDRAAYAALHSLNVESAFEGPALADRSMAQLCIGAVWLLYDYLDESHRISQQVETASGSYWHGIMHRREPDYSNAKYWFRRVGSHPVFESLPEAARECAAGCGAQPAEVRQFLDGSWDALAFVDLCQMAARSSGDLENFCRQVQQAEWELLFDYCYRRAVGSD